MFRTLFCFSVTPLALLSMRVGSILQLVINDCNNPSITSRHDSVPRESVSFFFCPSKGVNYLCHPLQTSLGEWMAESASQDCSLNLLIARKIIQTAVRGWWSLWLFGGCRYPDKIRVYCRQPRASAMPVGEISRRAFWKLRNVNGVLDLFQVYVHGP